MIRGYIAAHGGLAYVETVSRRAQRTRRRMVALTSVASMACAISLLGALTAPDHSGTGAPPAPSPLHLIRF